jgi:hypothetical protein
MIFGVPKIAGSGAREAELLTKEDTARANVQALKRWYVRRMLDLE